MALAPGTCPSGYQYYNCASPPFTGCCSVDPCAAPGCPPGKEYSPGSTAPGSTASLTTPASATPQPPRTTQSTGSSLLPTVIIDSGTFFTPTTITSTTTSPLNSAASSAQLGAASASSTQQSPTTSSTQLAGKNPGHSSSPLLSIIAISVGGVLGILIIVLIIFLYRRRRRQKSENSAGGLPTHGSVPEPTLDDGSATDPEELPSPSFPSEHNSVIPGFTELPISSVSELSSADRAVYSSTNVSTASTGAVVSPMPHDSLRGGGRPVMMPNMVPAGREQRRKHALSWQSFETGDGQ
ncbi:hypothetical protein B9Z19DRAFT_540052 [Tuber borchii]|uniref:Uncharacterized protein n=1 Tax=Tuber borchii TaxID=42251 RepID=A0A2T6ZDE1_TUBBO|nr:hypothetical protein B9Z19DRAFT_540052 [Tuber borchii]